MNVDDEIFLSAYLDGALEPEQRARVESALLSDHRLLDRLHSLAAVRELVATLPRPPLSHDLSVAVIETIMHRRVGILALRRLAVTSPSWRLGAATGAAAAAAAVLAVVLGFGHRPKGVEIPKSMAVIARPSARPAPVEGWVKLPVEASISPTPARPPAEPATVSLDAPALAISDADRKQEAERRQVRDLIDHPELLTMLFVNDVPGGDAPRMVGELLERTPFRHARFGRLTISQGIHIDPAHPGKATVYAVVMEESELREFQKTLRGSFGDAVVEAEPRPEVVTQLAQIDDVAVVQGRAVANVTLPEGPKRGIRVENKDAVVKKSLLDSNGRLYRHPDGTVIDDPSVAVADKPIAPLFPNRARQTPGGSNPSPASPPEKGIRVDRRPSESVVLIGVTCSSLDEGPLR